MKKENFENALTDVKEEYIHEAAEKKRASKKKLVWRIIPAAAVLAACLILTVNALAPVDMGFYLQAAFGDGYEMLDEMTSMPDNVAYKSSGDEIELELKGIVGDGQVVKVFVDLTLSADVEVPDGLGKPAEAALFDLKLSPTGLPWEKHIGSHSATTDLISKTENDDGSMTHSYVLTLKSADGVLGGKYVVSCTKMTYWDPEAQAEMTLMEGEWNLAFSLNYKDLSEKIPLGVNGTMRTALESLEGEELVYEYFEAPVEVYEVSMSPLSLSVFWKAENEYRDVFLGNEPDGISITMTDGSGIIRRDYYEDEEIGKFRLNGDGTRDIIDDSEIAPIYITGSSSGGSVDGHGEPYMGHMIVTFDAPLDTENVKSVTIGGIEIMLR